LYERDMLPPEDRETEPLIEMGEPGEGELSEQMMRWREHYERGQAPNASGTPSPATPSQP
jgi:hypothetical protein